MQIKMHKIYAFYLIKLTKCKSIIIKKIIIDYALCAEFNFELFVSQYWMSYKSQWDYLGVCFW